MYELFLDIEGYEGLYQVSNMGRVRNVKTGRFLKQSKDNTGYLKIELNKNGKGKTIRVHRLVLSTFKANPDNKTDVNHINEDKTDNRLNNLEWATRKENNNHGTRSKRSAETKKKLGYYDNRCNGLKVLCVETGVVYKSLREAGRCNDLTGVTISKCCRGGHKTAGGYHWKYYE